VVRIYVLVNVFEEENGFAVAIVAWLSSCLALAIFLCVEACVIVFAVVILLYLDLVASCRLRVVSVVFVVAICRGLDRGGMQVLVVRLVGDMILLLPSL